MFTLRIKMRNKISNEIFRILSSVKIYYKLIKYYVDIKYKLRKMNFLNKFKSDDNFKNRLSSEKFNNDRSNFKSFAFAASVKAIFDANKSKNKNKSKFDRSKNRKNFKTKISLKNIICYDCQQKKHYKRNFACSKYKKKHEDRNRESDAKKIKI